jgi:hypothetical protein
MRFPSQDTTRKQFLGITIANEKILGQDGLIYRGGIEVFPSSVLALRLGYEVGPELSGYACGAGLVVNVVRLDYALSRQGVGFLHYATITCEL